MKKKLLFIFCFLLFGCSDYQEDKFAEYALTTLGSGKFSGSFEELRVFDEIASRGGCYNICRQEKTYKNELEYSLIETAFLFKDFKIINKQKDVVDLYYYVHYPDEADSSNADHIHVCDILKEAYKNTPKYECYENGDFSFLEYSNVDVIRYRVKINNEKLMYLEIINHPKDGYRVISFYDQLL